MRNEEWGIWSAESRVPNESGRNRKIHSGFLKPCFAFSNHSSFRIIPHSAFRIAHSAFLIPHSKGGFMPQHFVILLALTAALGGSILAQASGVMDRPVTVDYYYKAKWGYADEFLRLFLKNHYPVLKKQKEKGNILQIQIVKPRYHATEDGRWDYRVTLVYRNPAAMLAGPLSEPEMRQLYPDKTAFEREEQRRFEILLAHWDVPIEPVEPEQR
jgi:hypothetical protein